jgi:membrane associated rhomboid family serine protease
MNNIFDVLARIYTQTPWIYISWPVAAMVAGTIIHFIWKNSAVHLGLVPRTARGLMGIITAPFIHANAAHLAANLPPFIVLGALVLRRNETQFLGTACSIALLEGSLLWVAGRRAAHIGMSGVVLGFFGSILATAWFTRTATDIIIAVVVLFVYGGMLAGIKPARNGTSWEGHFFGLVAGITQAWFSHL